MGLIEACLERLGDHLPIWNALESDRKPYAYLTIVWPLLCRRYAFGRCLTTDAILSVRNALIVYHYTRTCDHSQRCELSEYPTRCLITKDYAAIGLLSLNREAVAR